MESNRLKRMKTFLLTLENKEVILLCKGNKSLLRIVYLDNLCKRFT